MRRGLLLGIGFLEALVAGVLIVVGGFLPPPDVVERSFDRAGAMTKNAEKQVQLMQGQIAEVRQRDFPGMARQLRAQTDSIAANVRDSAIDFDTVEAMGNAFASVSRGFEGWSETPDRDHDSPAPEGLGANADDREGSWPAERAKPEDDPCELKSSSRKMSFRDVKKHYDQARLNSHQISQTAADLLESSTAQIDVRLGEQEQALGQMERGLHEVGEAIPAVKQSAGNFLVALRWMFWVVGGLIGLHGLFLACESRGKR